MAKKEVKTEENKLSLVVDFSGFVELPEGVTAEKRAEEIKSELEALKVESIEDKANYEVARERLTQLVKLRTTIEKVRKEKNGPVTDAKKRIDDTAKTLTALFQSAESIAEKKVRDFTAWEEEIKNFRSNQLKARQEYLINNGFPFNGEHFVCIIEGETICAIAPKQISMSDDVQWDSLLKEHINPAVQKWTAFKAEEQRLFEEFKTAQKAPETKNFFTHTIDTPSIEPVVQIDDASSERVAFFHPNQKIEVVEEYKYISKEDVIGILKKVLSNFKALQKVPSTQTMQLEAVIDHEIKNL